MKAAIQNLLLQFAQSFDQKDWRLMEGSLAKEIYTDYSSFRGTPPEVISRAHYIEKRKAGLAKLDTLHRYENIAIGEKEGEIWATCSFVIERQLSGTERFYHSVGQYEFGITFSKGNYQISKIIQEVTHNTGDQSIHGAFQKK